MEPIEIKTKIHNTIEGLTHRKLEIALAFLQDLKRSDEDETHVLLSEAGFIEDYREAKKDIRTGRTISWEAIKRDV